MNILIAERIFAFNLSALSLPMIHQAHAILQQQASQKVNITKESFEDKEQKKRHTRDKSV